MAKHPSAFRSARAAFIPLLCLMLIFISGPQLLQAEAVSTDTPETMPPRPSETGETDVSVPTETTALSEENGTDTGRTEESQTLPTAVESQPFVAETAPDPDLGQAFPGGADRLSILLPLSRHGSDDNSEKFTDLLSGDVYASSLLALGFPDLNPLRGEGRIERLLSALLYRPLQAGREEDGLLESWIFDQEGRELELVLKDHLRWSDGELLSARDLEFSLIALMKKGACTPGLHFIRLLRGYEHLASREDFAEPREGEKAQPYVNCPGIQAVDDRHLHLSFTEDARPYLAEILALQPIPSHCWWEEAPLYWQQLDHAASELYASSGAYTLSRLENERDLLLARRSALPSGYTSLFLRPVPEERALDLLLESGADLGLFASLSAEQRLRLKTEGFHLQDLPSDEQILLTSGAPGSPNPFAGPHGNEILSLLLPDLKDFSASSGEHFLRSAREDLAYLSQETRQQKAFRLLLEDGWVCLGLPQESMDSFQSEHPEIELKTFPSFAIAYDSADPALGEIAYLLQLAFGEAQLPIQSLALPLSGSGVMEQLPAYAALRLERSCVSPHEKSSSFSLLRSTVVAAAKEGLLLTFDEVLPFLGAEHWSH